MQPLALPHRSERGITLIEMMIALVVLSLGVLAIAQLFPAGTRRQVRDLTCADRDRPGGHLLEAGDHPQQRRLAATRRPHEDEELAAADRQRDAVDGDHSAGEDLADVVEDDFGHAKDRGVYTASAV